MNVTFKQVQLLPALTPAMIAGEHAPRTFRATRPARPTPAREAARPAAARQLPRPRADQNFGERALFVLLALSAVFCMGQALVTMIHWEPNLPGLTAWLAQLLG